MAYQSKIQNYIHQISILYETEVSYGKGENSYDSPVRKCCPEDPARILNF